MLFPSDTKLKIRFKRKNMFRETTVHKLQPFTLIFCVPFPARWTLAITFILLLLTTNNITSFFVPLSVKGFLVYGRLEKLCTATSSVIDLSNKFVDWMCFGDGGAWCMLSGSNISSDLGKYTVIIDGSNFMAEKSFGVCTTIWPDFTFRRMAFLMVPPTSSIVEPAKWLIQEHCSC